MAAGSATDLLVEVGAEGFLEGLDEALRGQKAGDIVEFATTLPQGMGEEGGKAVEARVLVKQVKARAPPRAHRRLGGRGLGVRHRRRDAREALGGELRRLRLGAARMELEERLLDQLRDGARPAAAGRPHRGREPMPCSTASPIGSRHARLTIEQYLAATGPGPPTCWWPTPATQADA